MQLCRCFVQVLVPTVNILRVFGGLLFPRDVWHFTSLQSCRGLSLVEYPWYHWACAQCSASEYTHRWDEWYSCFVFLEEVLREDSEGELNVGQFGSISAVSSGQTFVYLRKLGYYWWICVKTSEWLDYESHPQYPGILCLHTLCYYLANVSRRHSSAGTRISLSFISSSLVTCRPGTCFPLLKVHCI